MATAPAHAALRVTPESLRELLRKAEPPDFNDIRLYGEPAVFAYSRGGAAHEVESGRRVARALNLREGYALIQLATIDGLDVPGFDGLVLDPNRRVVANYSLKTSAGRSLHFLNVERSLRRTQDFTATEAWVTHLLKVAHMHADAGSDRKAREVVLTSPRQIQAFTRHLRSCRIGHEAFGVGRGRPTWVLIDVKVWEPGHEARLRENLGTHPSITRTCVLVENQLRDVTPSCAPDLSANAEATVTAPRP